jgi:uncharacterized lipoprotein YddW (UPF0748 family)
MLGGIRQPAVTQMNRINPRPRAGRPHQIKVAVPFATAGLLVTVFIGALSSSTLAAESDVAPLNTEARGIWVHLSDFSAEPVEGARQIREFVNKVADANFNFILPWVLSDYVAALTHTNYLTTNPAAQWDSLGVLINAAAQRGMPAHIWYSFTYYKSAQSPEFNPIQGGRPEWSAKRLEPGSKITMPMTDVCASNPEARQWQLKLIDRMVDRYTNLAGIHIEEPGYGYTGNCGCERCQALFKQLYGASELDDINGPRSQDLKCLGTTDFIRQLRARLLQRNARLILSVNGGTDWQGDRTLGRDWRHWAERGWLDYYAAQCYTGDHPYFRSLMKKAVLDLAPTPVFAGIHIRSSGGTNPLPSILKEIEIARECGVSGIILFSGSSLFHEHLAALKQGPFKSPASYPTLTR